MSNEVTRGTKIGFFLAVFGSSIIFGTLNTFLIKYYIDIALIAPMAVGTMIFIARIWDAVNDFIMGTIADKTRTRWGRFRPYILILPLPIAIVTSLLFVAHNVNPTAQIVYMYITFIAWGMIFTAIDIPMWALAGAVTSAAQERKSLMSSLSLGSLVGTILPGVLGVGILTALGGLDNPAAYTKMGILFGVIGSAMMFILFFTSKERGALHKSAKPKLSQILKAFFSTRQIWLFIIFQVFANMPLAINMAIGIYYAEHVLDNVNYLSLLLLIGGAGVLSGILVFPYLGRRIENRKLLIGCMAFAILSSITYYFVGYDNIFLVGLFTLLPTFAFGIVMVAIPVILADLSEYIYYDRKVSMAGVVFATKTFCVKLSHGLTALTITALLTVLHYIPGVRQTPEVVEGLFKAVTLLPALLFFLALIPLLFYNSDEKRINRIGDTELKADAFT